MEAFVRHLMQDTWGKALVGVVAAVVFSAIYWHFAPAGHGAMVVYVLALVAGGYKFYTLENPA